MGKLRLFIIVVFVATFAQSALADTPPLCKKLFSDDMNSQQRPSSRAEALAKKFEEWNSRVKRDASLYMPQFPIGVSVIQKNNKFLLEVRFFKDGEANSKKYGTRYEIPGEFQYWRSAKKFAGEDHIIIATTQGLIHFSPFKGIIKQIPYTNLRGAGPFYRLSGFGADAGLKKAFLAYKKEITVVDIASGQVIEQFDSEIANPRFGLSQSETYVIYGSTPAHTGTEVEILDPKTGQIQNFSLPGTVAAITAYKDLVAYADLSGDIFLVNLKTQQSLQLSSHYDAHIPLKRISSLKFQNSKNSDIFLTIKNNSGEVTHESLPSFNSVDRRRSDVTPSLSFQP